jgi:hypothetical protein
MSRTAAITIVLTAAIALVACDNKSSSQAAVAEKERQLEESQRRLTEERDAVRRREEEVTRAAEEAKAVQAEAARRSEEAAAKEQEHAKRTALPHEGRIKKDLIGSKIEVGNILFSKSYAFDAVDEFLAFSVLSKDVGPKQAVFNVDATLRKGAGSSARCFSKFNVTYKRADENDSWRYSGVKAQTFTCE